MTSDWGALGTGRRGDADSVIYYRRPDNVVHANWITWGDSLSGTKLRDFTLRGFQPLMKYGQINTSARDLRRFGDKSHPPEPEMTPEKYTWEAILSHPDGPAEFPVDQIVSFGWYRPASCPVPEAFFPQLQGHKIRELTCPERCGRKPFVELDGVGGVAALRQHLRIMHRWDQANLQAYGERVGIDFNRADVEEIHVSEMEFTPEPPISCEQCGHVERGAMAQARMARHKRTHPVVEVTTV